jgi:hypothetical protein
MQDDGFEDDDGFESDPDKSTTTRRPSQTITVYNEAMDQCQSMEVADNELPSAQLAIHVTSEGGGLP